MLEHAEYWSRLLAAIATEGIAIQATAKRESLAMASLYDWRKRLNAANSKDSVAVQLPQRNEDSGCQLCIGAGVQRNFPQLPSPALAGVDHSEPIYDLRGSGDPALKFTKKCSLTACQLRFFSEFRLG